MKNPAGMFTLCFLLSYSASASAQDLETSFTRALEQVSKSRAAVVTSALANTVAPQSTPEAMAEDAIARVLEMKLGAKSLVIEGKRVGAVFSNRECRFHLNRDRHFYVGLFASGFIDMHAVYQHGEDSVIKYQPPQIVENSDSKVRIEVAYTVTTNGIQGNQFVMVERKGNNNRKNYTVTIGTKNSAGVDGAMACTVFVSRVEE